MKYLIYCLLVVCFFTWADERIDVSTAPDFYDLDYTCMGDGGSGGGPLLARVETFDVVDQEEVYYKPKNIFEFLFGPKIFLKKSDCRNIRANYYTYSLMQEVYLKNIFKYETIDGRVIPVENIVYFYVDARKLLEKRKKDTNVNLLPFQFDALIAFELMTGEIIYKEDLKYLHVKN